MAIENTFLALFDPRSSIVKSVLGCPLPGVSRGIILKQTPTNKIQSRNVFAVFVGDWFIAIYMLGLILFNP